jgi:hypothetical protein
MGIIMFSLYAGLYLIFFFLYIIIPVWNNVQKWISRINNFRAIPKIETIVLDLQNFQFISLHNSKNRNHCTECTLTHVYAKIIFFYYHRRMVDDLIGFLAIRTFTSLIKSFYLVSFIRETY